MAAKVLDSSALMLFFEGRDGAEVVKSLILRSEQKKTKLLICAINLGEVWSSIASISNVNKANEYVAEINNIAIELVDADWSLTRIAMEIKHRHDLSIGSCFAIALAKIKRAELISADKDLESFGNEIKLISLAGRKHESK